MNEIEIELKQEPINEKGKEPIWTFFTPPSYLLIRELNFTPSARTGRLKSVFFTIVVSFQDCAEEWLAQSIQFRLIGREF